MTHVFILLQILRWLKKYAIKTVLIEKKLTSEERKKFGLTEHKNVGIVLQINAKNLEHSTDGITGLGLDPEDPDGADGSWLIYAGKKNTTVTYTHSARNSA